MRSVFVIFVLLAGSVTCFADAGPETRGALRPEAKASTAGESTEQAGHSGAEREWFWLAIWALIFAAFVIVAIIFLAWLRLMEPESVCHLMVITLISGFAVFIIPAGYDSRQIAPVIGLFGTVLGYLFGREQSRRRSPKTRKVVANSDKDTADKKEPKE